MPRGYASTARARSQVERRSASRGRLVQQSLIESICISLAGAIAGSPLAFAGVRALLRLAPPGAIPLADQVRVDGRVLSLGVAMVLICGILAGLAPALFVSRQSPHGALGRGGRVSERRPVLEVITASGIALALILLTAAGLLVRSILRLQDVQLGFEPNGVVVMHTMLQGERARSMAARRALRDQTLSAFASLPQAVVAAAGNRYLLGASPGQISEVTVEGFAKPGPKIVRSFVSPDYFRVLQIPVVTGRSSTDADDDRAPTVVLMSHSLATRLWPGQSAIGKRVWMQDYGPRMKDAPGPDDWATVVDVVQESIRLAPPGVLYYPINQDTVSFPAANFEFTVRTAGNPATTAPAMRQVMHALAPGQPVDMLAPSSDLVGKERLEPLFQARLIATFSLMALLLAAVGTYATLAYSVTERMHELGIRVALGAPPASVVGVVLRRGGILAIVGVFVGLAGSLILTRALQSGLCQTSATDPRVFALSAVLLVIVALGACIIPARRAMRVDPIVQLWEI